MEYGPRQTQGRVMKASFVKIESQGTAFTPGEMETSIKGITKPISGMGVDRCFGTMALFTRDHG